MAGLGCLLLCCWLFCCVWYIRRRQHKSEGDSSGEAFAQAEDPGKVAKLKTVNSLSAVEMGSTDNVQGTQAAQAGQAGQPAAPGMSNSQIAFHIAAQQHATDDTANAGEGGNGGPGTGGTVPMSNPHYEAQMRAVREQQLQLEKQKLEIQQMQNNLRIQQMQSQAMMQQQMNMLNNANMMPQPMIQPVNATNNGEGIGIGLAGGAPGGPVNYQLPMMPTNPVANAFTNGVAQAAMGEGNPVASDESSDDDVLFDVVG